MKVLVAVHDLMFTSKINAAAQGHELVWLPRGANLLDKAKEARPDVVLLDLGGKHFDAVAAVRALKADEATKGIAVLAYVGHTEEALIEGAKAAGADQIFSKGEFSRRLPELLRTSTA